MDVAKWIRSTAIATDHGRVWPANPADPKSISPGLYHGASGVVLFFLEAYRATKNDSYLNDTRIGADYLLQALEEEKKCGLYDGLAGIGFTLFEVHGVTRQEQYLTGATRCVQLLRERAKKVGKGVEWNDSTDIIRGSAGIGLFLLDASTRLSDPGPRNLAALAGRRMIELARPAAGGLKWAMTPHFPRIMPNFSHGTAGCGYFLVRLHCATNVQEYLTAAVAGANYLKSIARTDGNACLIFHHEPGGENLYYLGWCHGPAGTMRLFHHLNTVTGEPSWSGWMRRSANGILQSGIPDKRTPGFWNNVSQCCGSAGIAESFLDLHRITKDNEYLAFAKRLTDDLLNRATRDEKGMRWVQAEHRVQPDLLIAQTGYMQGAAGVGMWLLHLDGFERGRHDRITLPDRLPIE